MKRWFATIAFELGFDSSRNKFVRLEILIMTSKQFQHLFKVIR